MPESVLVAAVRTPVGRAPKGALSTVRPDDLAATALSGAFDKVPALDKSPSTTSSSAARSPKASRAGTSPGWQHCERAFPSKSPALPSTASAPPVSRLSRSPICASVPAARAWLWPAARNP